MTGVARRDVRARERKAGYEINVSHRTDQSEDSEKHSHTINLAQTHVQELFPEECFRRYPGLPGRRVTEGPEGDRGAFFFSSSATAPASTEPVPAGGRHSMT